MKKKVVLIAIIGVLLFIIAKIFIFKDDKTQTGAEWFKTQSKYIETLATLTDTIDSVTTLYVTKSISQADFLAHLDVFEKELIILKADRENDLKQKPVEIGTHSYCSKVGVESIDSIYNKLKELITYMKNNSSDTEKLSYAYIAYQQVFTQEFSKYEITYYILFGSTD